ncbi:hypothetical protein S83_017428 [Arachis hypogaea]
MTCDLNINTLLEAELGRKSYRSELFERTHTKKNDCLKWIDKCLDKTAFFNADEFFIVSRSADIKEQITLLNRELTQ